MRVFLKKTAAAAALILAAATFMTLFGCKKNSVPEKRPPERGAVINASPSSGEVVPILPDALRSFYVNYKDPSTADPLIDRTDLYYPRPVRISWTCDQDADYFIVALSMNDDIKISGSEDTDYFVTVDNYIEVTELFSGKLYYYRVFAVKGSDVLASVLFSFKTEDYIRTVYIDGISNTRDLGGKVGMNGKRIKQGIIYRGGYLDPITKQGKVDILEKLGVKTEIDLRTGTEISVIRKNVNVVSVKAPMYVGGEMGIDLPEYQPELAKEIKTFADPDNYPIYFHCAIGRDRTGTLACIIELIAGVSEEDIVKDYCVSFFSSIASGDEVVPSVHAQLIRNLIKYIREYSNGDLNSNLRKFLNDIGVTDEEISAIRKNILED